MNYGGLWAELLFIAAVDSSRENRSQETKNVRRLHTTEEEEPARERRES